MKDTVSAGDRFQCAAQISGQIQVAQFAGNSVAHDLRHDTADTVRDK